MASGPSRKIIITRDQANELFSYDPASGALRWRIKPYPGARAKIGEIAGRPGLDGRWSISIKRQKYLRSRLVWLFHHEDPGPDEIDHADRDHGNDRIENLRIASRSQQLANRGLLGHNTSGYRSIYYDARKNRWAVRVSIFGKRKRYGTYRTAEEAASVATKIGREAYGDFWAD